MDFPRWKLADVRISHEGISRSVEEALDKIARDVFAKLEKEQRVSTRSEQEELDINIVPQLGGRSAAMVFRMSAESRIQTENRLQRSYIIRLHSGPSADEHANREREIVPQVANASGSDFLSAEIVDTTVSNAVVYRHAADLTLSAAENLGELIVAAIKNGKGEDFGWLPSEMKNMLRAVNQVYASLASYHSRTISGENYFERLRRRLLPDLIIDARNRVVFIEDDIIGVENEDRTFPRTVSELDIEDADQLMDQSERLTVAGRWIKLRVSLAETNDSSKQSYLRLRSGSRFIWLRMSQEQIASMKLDDSAAYHLIFEWQDDVAFDHCSQAASFGFRTDKCRSIQELERFFRELEQLSVVMCHDDLHSGNVLASGKRLKAIDLASFNFEPAASSMARLEVSLWKELANRVEVEDDEVERILQVLYTDPRKIDIDRLSRAGTRLHRIMQAIRSVATEQYSQREIVIAYASQALVFQKYLIEELFITRFPRKRVGRPFIKVVEFWLSRLFEKSWKQERDGQQAKASAHGWSRGDVPTVGQLWHAALISPELEELDSRSRELLDALARESAQLLDYPLTGLQSALLSKCAGEPHENPFQSERNVIISAPTSTGKSTIAEMFLVRPSLFNRFRHCAVYIAPTRALTQAKHRDLVARFASDTHMADGLILSTGEDTDDDWRLYHGDFTIACMVYEKANILFSRNRKLIDRIGCIVVDEIHMLSDLQRGPILEVMLTKALHERRATDSQEVRSSADTIQVVTISTEDAPTDSMKKFLSSLGEDPLSLNTPIVVRDAERPVAVEHSLVVADENEKGYKSIPIVEFSSTDNRMLPQEQLRQINRKVHRHTSNQLERGYMDDRREASTRTIRLILDILSEHPRGHQILVFVPVRRQAEELARRLKNRRRKLFAGDQEVQHSFREQITSYLMDELEEIADRRIAETIEVCAQYGVLVHHSDVPKSVRQRIELLCADMGELSYSQVMFATETLSYGVNLAVNDVILLGVDFRTQTRFGKPLPQSLSICAFFNMSGRAGRLGKNRTGKTARVLIVIPQNQNPYLIVRDYYQELDRAKSQLYVSDDISAQNSKRVAPGSFPNPFMRVTVNNQELADQLLKNQDERQASDQPCNEHARLQASDLSYPFVRSVLDALRHLNMRHASGGTRAPVSIEKIRKFFENTLYARQKLSADANEEWEMFLCAIYRILESCSNDPLRLVEAHNRGPQTLYSITTRGEAIIDTGTLLTTITPLLEVVRSVNELWDNLAPGEEIPAEVFLLCIVIQEEVFEQTIHYAPEVRGRSPWSGHAANSNTEFLVSLLSKCLAELSGLSLERSRTIAEALRQMVAKRPEVATIPENYEGGAVDSLLRFFCGILAWIAGEDREDVIDMIEGADLPDGFRGRMFGFRQYRELIHYKVVFLARLLAPDKTGGNMPSIVSERDLLLLTSRLRYGCEVAAIPLFYPEKSKLQRREASKLLDKGLTPSQILTMAEPTDIPNVGIRRGKLGRLLKDLQSFVLKEFNDLRQEMTYDRDKRSDNRRKAVAELWDLFHESFSDSILTYHSEKADVKKPAAEILREKFYLSPETDGSSDLLLSDGVTSSQQGYRIQIEIPEGKSSLIWNGQVAVEDDSGIRRKRNQTSTRSDFVDWSTNASVTILAVHFRSNWECSVDGNSWESLPQLLADHKTRRSLVIIPMPWIPSFQNAPSEVKEFFNFRESAAEFSTVLISVAAFGLMSSGIVRDFIESESCVDILLARDSQRDESEIQFVGVQKMRELFDLPRTSQLPPVIREKLLGYFEVVPDMLRY